jgi:hypothetical protein
MRGYLGIPLNVTNKRMHLIAKASLGCLNVMVDERAPCERLCHYRRCSGAQPENSVLPHS